MIKERRIIMRDEILKKLIEKTAKVMRVDPSTLSENTNIKTGLNLKSIELPSLTLLRKNTGLGLIKPSFFII